MSDVMRYTFRLFGPRRGQTVTINGHKFIKGEFKAVVGTVAAAYLIKILSYYGAYAQFTSEYDKALAKEQAEDKANGGSGVQASEGSGPANKVSGNTTSIGSEPAETPAYDFETDVDPASDGEDFGADGDGHGHAGIPAFPENGPSPSEPGSVGDINVKTALLKLDPSNNDHWVMTGAHKGKPKLSAVEEAFGRAGLTRQDLEAAFSGFNRERAVEAALEG
jgi:hypothetical protein